MWEDIGLGDWLFDLDDEAKVAKVAKVVPAVLAMAKDFPAAKAKAKKARQFVKQRHRETMDQLKIELGR